MEAIYGSLMQELDRNTQKRIKSISLMEDAGVKMAEIVMDYCKPRNVLLLLGSGGNAGDAFRFRLFPSSSIPTGDITGM